MVYIEHTRKKRKELQLAVEKHEKKGQKGAQLQNFRQAKKL